MIKSYRPLLVGTINHVSLRSIVRINNHTWTLTNVDVVNVVLVVYWEEYGDNYHCHHYYY